MALLNFRSSGPSHGSGPPALLPGRGAGGQPKVTPAAGPRPRLPGLASPGRGPRTGSRQILGFGLHPERPNRGRRLGFPAVGSRRKLAPAAPNTRRGPSGSWGPDVPAPRPAPRPRPKPRPQAARSLELFPCCFLTLLSSASPFRPPPLFLPRRVPLPPRTPEVRRTSVLSSSPQASPGLTQRPSPFLQYPTAQSQIRPRMFFA